MFEKILVEASLVPIREAASQGNLDAMCQLARHILEGDRTRLCLDSTAALCECILDHKDFGEDIEMARSTIKLLADHVAQCYQEGRMSYADYEEGMRLMLRELVLWTVKQPEEFWNIFELKHAVDWLYEHPSEPLQTTN